MLKWTVRILATLILLVVIAAGALWIYVDRVATAGLTRGVAYAGEVPCQVGNVRVSLLTGRVGIEALAVGNPKGYPEADMFSIEQADLEVRVSSLWDQPVHVRRLEISRPVVRIEAGPGGSNVRVFLETVERKLVPEAAEPEKEHTRLLVDKLVIKDATVRIGTGVLSKELMEITLEDMELRDIHGQDNRGVTYGELTALIVVELIRRGALKGRLNLHNLLPAELMRVLDTLLKATSTVFNGTTGVIKKPLDTIWDLMGLPKTQPDGSGGTSRPAADP